MKFSEDFNMLLTGGEDAIITASDTRMIRKLCDSNPTEEHTQPVITEPLWIKQFKYVCSISHTNNYLNGDSLGDIKKLLKACITKLWVDW